MFEDNEFDNHHEEAQEGDVDEDPGELLRDLLKDFRLTRSQISQSFMPLKMKLGSFCTPDKMWMEFGHWNCKALISRLVSATNKRWAILTSGHLHPGSKFCIRLFCI